MTIWRAADRAATEPRADASSVVIGTFDGVHRGHQYLLAQAREHGGRRDLVAVTFDPHPRAVVGSGSAPARLTSVERRVQLLKQHGADEVRVLAFTREMSSWSPEEFVQRVIVDDLKARSVTVGANFRFGSKAAGDAQFLRQHGPEFGFDGLGVELVGPHGSSDADDVWSSSRVRAAVDQADMALAAQILGRWHGVDGEVTRGDQRGRDLGYPTANLPVASGVAAPPDGVYAGWLSTTDTRYPAAISVGTNPTFRGTERRVESYVLDHGHELDLYGRSVLAEFGALLRPMQTFDGVETLVRQMREDVDRARDTLIRLADSPPPWSR